LIFDPGCKTLSLVFRCPYITTYYSKEYIDPYIEDYLHVNCKPTSKDWYNVTLFMGSHGQHQQTQIQYF